MTRRPELLLVAGLTLAGAALRFSTLDLQSFWHDEAVTVGRVLDPSLFTTLDRVPGSEATPPLYYALAWAWTKLFGAGEVGIRSLSAVIGTATIPVAWWAGRELISRAAGVAAAALVAFSPYMVWYSQEARAYALLVLLCGLSLGLMARALRGDSARFVAWWALVAALALATHYFAVFVVVPELIALAWLAPARRRATLAAGAFVGAVGLALVPLAVYQADRGHDGWIERIELSRRLRDTGKQFVLGYSGSPSRALSVVAAVLLAVAAALALWHGRAYRGFRLAAGVGAAALAIPLLAKVVGADYLYPRNMIGAWVVLAVSLGAAAAAGAGAGWSRAGAAAIAGLCAVFLAIVIAVDTDTKLQRADWRGAAEAIGAAGAPRAIVVPAIGDDPIAYYTEGRRLPRGGATVDEILVLGFSAAPGPRDRQVPAGFKRRGRQEVGGFTLVRYRAPRPVRLGRPELAAARLGVGHAAVVVQRP
ncbi:MAG TPA: glycosyltransferase family 39 protein [Thermoleophilaceae bacterium]|nr:glycosyltransferase family 39 protein [Thermoleophilaceae bacterium]